MISAGAGSLIARAIRISIPMRLEPGKYFGSELGQRRTSGLCLTACRYAPDTKLPRHAHALPGFFLLISGEHRETNTEGESDQPESTLLFHEIDSPHETRIGPRGMTGLNIAFAPEWLERVGTEGKRRRDGWVLGRPQARRLATTLLANLQSGTEAKLENYGVELLNLIWDCQGNDGSAPPTWLVRVREAIETRFAEDLALTSLATEASVHPVYLARTFRRFYDLSVTDYLQNARLSNAFKLILDGRTIGEAAAESGFCDQAYLARLARAKFGVAPAEIKWFGSSKVLQPAGL